MTEIHTWTPPAGALPIWEGTPPGNQPEIDQPAPTLTPYLLPSGHPRAAVVIFPGGGYGIKAAHEAGPVALWLNGLGIAAFVLDYRVAPYRHPIPLLDARRALQLVRCHAEAWKIDPGRVGVLGFSAGGHLASTAGTHFEALAGPDDAVSTFSYRPDALLLCYPVISAGRYGHPGSMENLLGPGAAAETRAHLSNENQVSTQTPPTFLWHTANDPAVPVENSLLFATALSAHQVPFELHIFASGEHGVGLAQAHPSAGPWTELCARWLKNLGFTDRA